MYDLQCIEQIIREHNRNVLARSVKQSTDNDYLRHPEAANDSSDS